MGKTTSVQSHFVVFQLVEQICAVDLGSVREVLHMAELSRPLGLPALLEGFLALDGQTVPVINLRHVFGLPKLPLGLYTPLLILPAKTSPIAVIVDNIIDVYSIPDADLMPVQEHQVFNDCVVAEVLRNQSTVYILSVDRFLLKQEHQRIAELVQTEQERLANLT